VHACPGSDTAPTCFNKVMARRTLLGKAGACEGMVGVVREDGEPTGAPNRGGVRWSGGKTESEAGRGGPLRIGEGERQGDRHRVQPGGGWPAHAGIEAGL
jgi:hypothetical protein